MKSLVMLCVLASMGIGFAAPVPSANTLIVPGAEWKPRQLVTRADDQGEVKVNEGPVHANADDQGEAKVDQGPVHAKDNGDIFFSVATGILDGN